jgi:hypothetical protein
MCAAATWTSEANSEGGQGGAAAEQGHAAHTAAALQLLRYAFESTWRQFEAELRGRQQMERITAAAAVAEDRASCGGVHVQRVTVHQSRTQARTYTARDKEGIQKRLFAMVNLTMSETASLIPCGDT